MGALKAMDAPILGKYEVLERLGAGAFGENSFYYVPWRTDVLTRCDRIGIPREG